MEGLNLKQIKGCYLKWDSLTTNNYRSTGWTDKKTQNRLFKCASKLFKNKKGTNTLLDIGAGLGGFYIWLCKNGYSINYHGIDIIEEFADRCRAQGINVLCKNADQITRDYDYSVAIGTFHYMTFDCTNPYAVIARLVKRIMKHTRQSFFFTLVRHGFGEYHTWTLHQIDSLLKPYTDTNIDITDNEYLITINK